MNADARKQSFPIGASLRLTDLVSNPYPTFARLLAEEPISWAADLGMWLVSRRTDVIDILNNPQTFTVVSHRSLLRLILGYNMLTTDGDEQQRLRQPFVHPLAAKTVREQMTETIHSKVNQLIDAFVTTGQADLTTQFSDPLALIIVTQVLGLSIHDYATFRGWYHAYNAALGNYLGDAAIEQAGLAAKAAFASHVHEQLEQRRRQPDGSLLSQLANQHSLSDADIIDDLRVTIFGGLETTSALLGNALWALLRHPEAYAQVCTQPQRLNNAIEEAFRWESPVQTATRHLSHDVTLHGVTLRAGETLQCLLGAANRDPAYFDAPERFDIERANAADHVGFGRGRHFCVGAALARLEAQIGLERLLARLPNIRLSHDDQPQGHEFRAPARLRLAWDVP